MKLWLFGLGVCLFSTPELAAQSATPISNSWATFEAQRLIALAQEFSLDHVNQPTPSLRRSQDDAVVSLQRLTHKGDQRARKLSEKGLHEYRRHRYGEALSFLQKALETDPHSSVLQNNLGVVYCLLGQDEAAQQAFQQAIALDSSAAMSYVNLAKVAFNTYQYHLAEASAQPSFAGGTAFARSEACAGARRSGTRSLDARSTTVPGGEPFPFLAGRAGASALATSRRASGRHAEGRVRAGSGPSRVCQSTPKKREGKSSFPVRCHVALYQETTNALFSRVSLVYGEHSNPWGQAAFSRNCAWVCGRKPGYQRRNVSSHSSLSTRVRICRSRCAPRGVHCIC
jgi:Tfp pilus assembly protein PilF